MSPKEIRKLAWQYATKLKKNIPKSWSAAEIAGPDWFTCFLKRHPRLSIRTPEATSLARTSSFNPTNVKHFFDNLRLFWNDYNWVLETFGTLTKPGLIWNKKLLDCSTILIVVVEQLRSFFITNYFWKVPSRNACSASKFYWNRNYNCPKAG